MAYGTSATPTNQAPDAFRVLWVEGSMLQTAVGPARQVGNARCTAGLEALNSRLSQLRYYVMLGRLVTWEKERKAGSSNSGCGQPC